MNFDVFVRDARAEELRKDLLSAVEVRKTVEVELAEARRKELRAQQILANYLLKLRAGGAA